MSRAAPVKVARPHNPKSIKARNSAFEAWGERGWAAVARLCRWAEANGAVGLECPKAD